MLETSFRIHRDEETTMLQQNGKNRIRSYCYRTAVTAKRQVETVTAQRIFFTLGNVILTALTEFLRNLRNGKCNGETATAERQRNGGNQA